MNLVIITFLLGISLLGWYLSFAAGRLDRLHHRVETSWSVLDAAFMRRAALLIELSGNRTIDPASALILSNAAHRARLSDGSAGKERENIEGEIDQDLEVLIDQIEGSIRETLVDSQDRVHLALALHADAVRSVRKVREKRFVRLFRLAGRAPIPAYFKPKIEREP